MSEELNYTSKYYTAEVVQYMHGVASSILLIVEIELSDPPYTSRLYDTFGGDYDETTVQAVQAAVLATRVAACCR